MKTLLLISGLGAALSAGVLFGFSTFIMAALARLPAPAGIAAFQQIDVTVYNPAFMGVFMGTGVLGIAAAILAFRGAPDVVTAYVYLGAIIYLVGVIGVTMIGNVPMNNALGAMDANAASSAEYWTGFLKTWTNLNHVRTAAGLLSAALFILARA